MSAIGIIILCAIPIVLIICNSIACAHTGMDVLGTVCTTLFCIALGLSTNCLFFILACGHASHTPILETGTIPIEILSPMEKDQDKYYYKENEKINSFTELKITTDSSLPTGYFRSFVKREGNFITGEYTINKYIYNINAIN